MTIIIATVLSKRLNFFFGKLNNKQLTMRIKYEALYFLNFTSKHSHRRNSLKYNVRKCMLNKGKKI